MKPQNILLGSMILSLVLGSSSSWALQDVALPEFETQIQNLGISTTDYSPASHTKLSISIGDSLLEVNAKLETTADKDEEKALKFKRDLLHVALSFLERSQNAHQTQEKNRHYMSALRALYSMESESLVQEIWKMKLSELKLLASRLDTDIPYVRKEDRNKPVGALAAHQEASSLVDPRSGSVVSTSQLAQMSVEEISKLDLPEDHLSWLSDASMKRERPSWTRFEASLEANHGQEVVKDIVKKLKKEAEKEGRRFDPETEKVEPYALHKARKVLFLSKLKSTGTSAKVNTKDAYGQDWKLKWGNETQSEPIANRLIIRLGAKFADLVYANKAGRDGVVLVLEDKKTAGSCEHINSYEILRKCLLTSVYEMDVSPYVLERGVLTSSNIDAVLRNMPETQLKKYEKQTLIGREFLTFKESQTEFRSDDTQLRGGATAWSSLGALNDRGIRGNLLFQVFISNIDQKDENTRSVVLKNFKGCADPCYIEYSSDMGASFGKPSMSMLINNLGTGRDFMVRDLIRDSIKIKQFMLFRPAAWDVATFADHLWMARKIVSLKKTELEFAVSSSLWPDYMQKALVSILQQRRNHIAKVFDIEELIAEDERELDDLDVAIPLKTRSDRELAARKYGLNVVDIESALKGVRRLAKNGTSNWTDKPVVNGKVSPCSYSLISNLLEKRWYPSGLSRRQFRGNDSVAMSACEFTASVSEADFQRK